MSVDRFFNGLDVLRGFGMAVVFGALGAVAISYDDWQGWLIGSVALVLALSGLVLPWLRPRYHWPKA
jgi:hypothetical protein